ncbi:hypothetical protein [Actinoallomurus sp. NPDC050550]|uniref:hypothetical protein n=1 Tax=Actinoallomurus sp. NPDC050550 TaxID=3154937 RepID=UPI0033D30C23
MTFKASGISVVAAVAISCSNTSNDAKRDVYTKLPDPCSLVSSPTVKRLTGSQAVPSPEPPFFAGKLRQSSCSWGSVSNSDRTIRVAVNFHISGSASGGISAAKKYLHAGGCPQSAGQCVEVSGLGDEGYRQFAANPTPQAIVIFRLKNLVVQVLYRDVRIAANGVAQGSSQFVFDQGVNIAREAATRLPKTA